MKNIIRKATSLLLGTVLGASLLSACSTDSAIDGSQTVVTINDETVEMGVVSFYTKYQQALMYSIYGEYIETYNLDGMFDMSLEATSSEPGDTFGEQMKYTCLEDIEKMVVIRQHAEEYGVSLTEEEQTQIEEIAQSYIDSNSEEVLEKIGATKEQIVELLTLQTIQANMLDPMVADVDTEVSDEEAQQTAVTYIAISEDTVAEEESTADLVAEASSDAESTESVVEVAATAEKQQTLAEEVMAYLSGVEDIATADLSSIVLTIDENLTATTGHYTTNDTTDGTIDSEVVAAVQNLEDGTLYDGIITGSDGSTLYIARLDAQNDEEYTASTKETIVRTRKENRYDELTEGWLQEAEIKVDESVFKTLVITDQDPVTLKAPEEAESSVETVSGDDLVVTYEEDTVEEADETSLVEAAESIAEAGESQVETVDSIEE